MALTAYLRGIVAHTRAASCETCLIIRVAAPDQNADRATRLSGLGGYSTPPNPVAALGAPEKERRGDAKLREGDASTGQLRRRT